MTIPSFVTDCTKTVWVAGVAGQRTALTSIELTYGSANHNCVVFMGLRAIDLLGQRTVLLAVDSVDGK